MKVRGYDGGMVISKWPKAHGRKIKVKGNRARLSLGRWDRGR